MQLRLALIVASAIGMFSSNAHAKEWNIGCANLACFAVDNLGNVIYLDTDGAVVGTDKLPVKSPNFVDKPTAPIRVACSAAIDNGEHCEIVDGAGRIWVGPPRPTPDDPIQLISGSLPK